MPVHPVGVYCACVCVCTCSLVCVLDVCSEEEVAVFV